MKDEKDFIDSVLSLCKSFFGSKSDSENDESEVSEQVPVIKQRDDELKRATFVVMKSFRDDDSACDLHGDTWDDEDIVKARDSFRENGSRLNLEHLLMIDDSIATVDEDYITAADMYIGDEFITKGSWIQTWQINDDSLWEDVKSGEWCGLSIQCAATEDEL